MADVVYRFISTGQDAVEAAFQSITTAAQKSAASVEKSYERDGNAAKKVAKVHVSEAQKAAAELERIRTKENNALQREGDKLIAAEEKAAAKRIALEDRTSQKIAATRAKYLRDSATAAISSVASYGAGLVSRAADALASMTTGAIRESMHLDDIARQVSINARGAGEDFKDPTKLRKSYEDIAISTPGIKSDDIAEASQAYIDFTGDVKTAESSLKTFATVASATNASVKDVALAAASFGEKFKVSDPEEVKKLFAVLIFQGKGAKLTLEQMGKAAQSLAPAAAAFGVESGVTGIAKTGALLQIARAGTGSAAQATTGARNILTGLKLRSKKYAGVDVYDKDHNVRDVNQVLAETIAKAGGTNPAAKDAALAKIFGRGAGMQAVSPLISAFTDASRAAGGGKTGQQAGLDAVLEKLRKLSDVTDMFSEVEKDAAFAQQSTSAQLIGAWEAVKATLANDILPALKDMAPSFKAGMPVALNALAMFASTLVAVAETMGLIAHQTHGDKAKELEDKANAPGISPEEKAALTAKANLERARGNTTSGVAGTADELEAKFMAQFTKAGGNTIGERFRAGQVASDVADPTSIFHGPRQSMINGTNLAHDGTMTHSGGINAEQTALLEQYRKDHDALVNQGRGAGKRSGGPEMADKGIASMATGIAAVVKAELASGATAQKEAAAALKESAVAIKGAAKGGTIHAGGP